MRKEKVTGRRAAMPVEDYLLSCSREELVTIPLRSREFETKLSDAEAVSPTNGVI
jgi:hypothetical protein